VMLRIIDQKWREHLYEMDYLREGIGLRAMGQKDPLVEWQREGFEMFGEMMKHIATDFVKYVMHAQVQVAEQKAEPETKVQNLTYTAPTDPSEAAPGFRAAAAAEAAATGNGGGAAPAPDLGKGATAAGRPPAAAAAADAGPQAPVVKSDWDKTPRNAPCPCGSGKKFKLCHGAG
jgi:preprotein translocase subunit SecA